MATTDLARREYFDTDPETGKPVRYRLKYIDEQAPDNGFVVVRDDKKGYYALLVKEGRDSKGLVDAAAAWAFMLADYCEMCTMAKEPFDLMYVYTDIDEHSGDRAIFLLQNHTRKFPGPEQLYRLKNISLDHSPDFLKRLRQLASLPILRDIIDDAHTEDYPSCQRRTG